MSAAEPMPHLPPEFAVKSPPWSDEDLGTYFDVMDAGPNQELRHDGTPDPELSQAVELASYVAGWRIEDDEQAEWALRKMLEANDQLSVLHQQRDAWLYPIDQWYERTTKRPERTMEKMRELLEDYAERRQAAGGAKTLELPSGTLKVSESKPTTDVEDDEALAAWITANAGTLADAMEAAGITEDDLVKLTAKVYVGPLRKLAKVGEVPDGNELRETYSCGHWRSMSFSGEPDDVPGIGEPVECHLCEPDPIDGYPTVAIVAAEVTARTRLAVLGPDGAEVPGAVVKPGGITPKVVLGR